MTDWILGWDRWEAQAVRKVMTPCSNFKFGKIVLMFIKVGNVLGVSVEFWEEKRAWIWVLGPRTLRNFI